MTRLVFLNLLVTIVAVLYIRAFLAHPAVIHEVVHWHNRCERPTFMNTPQENHKWPTLAFAPKLNHRFAIRLVICSSSACFAVWLGRLDVIHWSYTLSFWESSAESAVCRNEKRRLVNSSLRTHLGFRVGMLSSLFHESILSGSRTSWRASSWLQPYHTLRSAQDERCSQIFRVFRRSTATHTLEEPWERLLLAFIMASMHNTNMDACAASASIMQSVFGFWFKFWKRRQLSKLNLR